MIVFISGMFVGALTMRLYIVWHIRKNWGVK